MTSLKRLICIAALVLLAFVCPATTGSDSDDNGAATPAITVEDNADNAPLPDFDGDGTIGIGDFLIFVDVFGSRQGDEKYEARYDLDGNGEIGISDFLIFIQDFGKDVPPSLVVAIPDANLRAVIEAALSKPGGAPITQAEMTTLDILKASNADISDLTGLEFAINLIALGLASNNRIADLSPLSGLNNLTSLHLWNNNISDLSPLSGLTNLTLLSLDSNNISDLSPLSGLTNLTSLSLDSNNRIADLSPLSGLTNLTSLNLDINNISDLSPLSGLTNLTGVSLDSNNISDVSPLSELISLTSLNLWNNNISDVSPLSELISLTWLSLDSNNISDVSPLSELISLTWLSLASNNISDVSPLSGLTNLTELNLDSNNRIADFSPLSGLNNLTRLNLWNNNISDMSPLSELISLTELGLRNNRIADLSPLSGLTNLTELNLDINNISDLSPLSGLNNLTELGLEKNEISDVSPLSELISLTELGLHNNRIADLSPLSGLNNLTELNLDSNNISDVSPLSGLTNLTRLDLRNNRIADLSPLAANSGLAQGTEVDVRGNPLSTISYSIHVPALQSRGVDLHADPATIVEYDAPTFVAQHDDRVVVMGVPGRLKTDPIDFEALARAFFTHYEDAFDYLMVLSNHRYTDNEYYPYVGIHLSARNDVDGTGKSRYSRNQTLGSAGRLNAILHFPYNNVLPWGPVLHEIMHSWANFTIPTAAGGHWGFSSANGQLGGFDRSNLVDHGGGRYSAGRFGTFANGGNGVPYSPIELYFAGLIPPSEVPDLWVAEDGTELKDASGNWVYDDSGYKIFTASRISEWSIERIVAEHGTRMPDSRQSQKHFRAALILAVDPLHPPRQSTLDNLSEAVQVFTHAGKDDSITFNFWEATGGRATLTMDGLSAYRRAGGAGKRAVSYRIVEPEANQDGSIGCVHQMDDAVWAGAMDGCPARQRQSVTLLGRPTVSQRVPGRQNRRRVVLADRRVSSPFLEFPITPAIAASRPWRIDRT